MWVWTWHARQTPKSWLWSPTLGRFKSALVSLTLFTVKVVDLGNVTVIGEVHLPHGGQFVCLLMVPIVAEASESVGESDDDVDVIPSGGIHVSISSDAQWLAASNGPSIHIYNLDSLHVGWFCSSFV